MELKDLAGLPQPRQPAQTGHRRRQRPRGPSALASLACQS